MKTPNDLFSRLPTVTELLENPRIKGLVDRVQEMEVTTGVRQFVDRMRQEVSRRAFDAPIPSIGELADRAARFILGRHAAAKPQAINATGMLWPPGLSGPPLADEALAAVTAAAQHYHVRGGRGAADLVAELSGAPAAQVFATPAGALLASLAALGEGRPVVLARGELGTLDGNVRVTDLAKQAGVELVEVGAADSVSLDDYLGALESGAGTLLRIEALPHALRGQTCRPELAQLVRLAHEHSATVIHNIGRGALVPLGDGIELDVVTATQSLAAGASLVVARGDGYTGGPRCGMAIGRAETVHKVTSHPLCGVLAADPLVEAALAGTLSLLGDAERGKLAIPTLARLSTPLLNLQGRAERLAAQIAAEPGIVSATPLEISAGDDMGAARPLPSFGISVICDGADLARIQGQLDTAQPQVVGNWHGDRVVLDLRTVSPGEDIALVAAFAAPTTTQEIPID